MEFLGMRGMKTDSEEFIEKILMAPLSGIIFGHIFFSKVEKIDCELILKVVGKRHFMGGITVNKFLKKFLVFSLNILYIMAS
ncbi:MAG: hypothetical protein LBN94_01835 [Puniceicoccales bacterium]|jgi:hypothetical protein|nr:hypothetical protein [Puniceicoccales bacterium]